MMKKVVIVREGQWGLVKKKIAEVEVVEASAEALLKLRMGGIDTLIFISRDKLAEARQIKKVHRRLKVVLFTGLIPEEEIILVDKGWLLDSREIKHIVLY